MDEQTFSNDLVKLHELANKFQAAAAKMVETWEELQAFRFTVKNSTDQRSDPDALTSQSVSS